MTEEQQNYWLVHAINMLCHWAEEELLIKLVPTYLLKRLNLAIKISKFLEAANLNKKFTFVLLLKSECLLCLSQVHHISPCLR